MILTFINLPCEFNTTLFKRKSSVVKSRYRLKPIQGDQIDILQFLSDISSACPFTEKNHTKTPVFHYEVALDIEEMDKLHCIRELNEFLIQPFHHFPKLIGCHT